MIPRDSFTPEEKAFIELVAQEVAKEIVKNLIAQHIAICPWGKKWTRLYYVGCGLLVGTGAVNVLAIAKLVGV